jgi:hypothetical protein
LLFAGRAQPINGAFDMRFGSSGPCKLAEGWRALDLPRYMAAIQQWPEWGNLTPSCRSGWTAGVGLESGPSLELIDDRDFWDRL